MKFLKRFVLFLLLLVLALVLIGFYVLPDEARVERDALVDAPPAEVFPYLSDFRRFNQWSPWSDWAPDIEYDYSGPESGVGARMSWHSENPEVGTGSILITESRPPERVVMRLELGPQGDAASSFEVEPAGNGSRVVWSFRTEFGNNVIKRYFGLMLERWVGQDYEQGLQNLKALVEGKSDE
ncbi:MAG TPA: SRPBCC family protein [Arenicellales bacterium]|nr:SRPBCC family protein [Arenicellales bacterium]